MRVQLRNNYLFLHQEKSIKLNKNVEEILYFLVHALSMLYGLKFREILWVPVIQVPHYGRIFHLYFFPFKRMTFLTIENKKTSDPDFSNL